VTIHKVRLHLHRVHYQTLTVRLRSITVTNRLVHPEDQYYAEIVNNLSTATAESNLLLKFCFTHVRTFRDNFIIVKNSSNIKKQVITFRPMVLDPSYKSL